MIFLANSVSASPSTSTILVWMKHTHEQNMLNFKTVYTTSLMIIVDGEAEDELTNQH